MRAISGFITRGGKFYENESSAKRAELVEDIKEGVWTRHCAHFNGISELVLDYILDTYTLVKKK